MPLLVHTSRSMFSPSDEALSVRPMTPADQPFLLEVYASTRREEVAVAPWTDEAKAAFLRMQFRAQHMYYQEHYADTQFLIIRVAGRAAGRLYLQYREDELRVVDIALLPAYRGRGIGGRLMQDVLDEAAREQKPVRIHVEHDNPALRLYERLGFQRIGDTGVYYLMECQTHERCS